MSKAFKKKLKLDIEKYTFDVGILSDNLYFDPIKPARGEGYAHGNFAGKTVRKKSRLSSGLKLSELFIELQKNAGVNLLKDPFKNKKNKEILTFANDYLRFVFKSKKTSIKRLENLAQAIIRNPILRGDYGQNSALTQKIKGFNSLFIDTAQTFKSIRAKVKRVRG